ncbi:uncharacterized protein LOC105248342 [Camponotus floridanus]|uniref:uncharacterized protein LOC105248342 n=1 Tax=Camponotus floridanus TaxID=104421 RepID=UPI000DC66AF9|nr:uncharacterized protein LOC105248342 [Camponotus floridanus]
MDTQWKWNYFTLKSLCKVKCSLCNKVYKPKLCRTEALKNHINENKEKDLAHNEAYLEYVFKDQKWKEKSVKEFKWDSHYKIISSNIILKPNVRCKHCKVDIPAPCDDTPFLRAPKGLSKHLKHDHNIEFKNWKAFKEWIYKYAKKYGPNIPCPRENKVIKVRRCEVCKAKIRAKNAIMFVKHLIDEHYQEIQPLPADIIPKELQLDYDPDDKFDDFDVSTDSDDSSESDISEVNVPSTITQPLLVLSQSGQSSQSGSSQPSQSSQSSQSRYTSKESPSKRKRNSSRQTKEHPSKRKKDSST